MAGPDSRYTVVRVQGRRPPRSFRLLEGIHARHQRTRRRLSLMTRCLVLLVDARSFFAKVVGPDRATGEAAQGWLSDRGQVSERSEWVRADGAVSPPGPVKLASDACNSSPRRGSVQP